PVTLVTDDGDDADDDEASSESSDDVQELRFSRVERLAEKDFAACSAAERSELYDALAALRIGGPTRRSLRLEPAHGTRGQMDLRRTVQEAKRTGGETLTLRTRRPRRRPRRL